MNFEGCIFGLGAPLLDIIANVDAEYLKKYDLSSNNAIRAESKHLPIFDEISRNFDVNYMPGGATLNVVKIAAWILGGNNVTSCAGCIASDEYGKILERSCVDAGVHPMLQYTKHQERTGTCAVLVTGQERSLVTNLGAANNFTEDHFDDLGVWDWVEKSSICYVTGYFLSVCPPAIMRVAKHTSKSGTRFSLNLSATFLCDSFKEPMMEVMPYVDLLFGNESEAVAFAKSQEWDYINIADIALEASRVLLMTGKRPRIVVFTQGPGSVISAHNGKVTEYLVPSMPQESIIDTTGAGDAFVGGFLAQFVKEKSLPECVEFGVKIAQLVIQRVGCTLPETLESVKL